MLQSQKPIPPPRDSVWEVYCDGATYRENPAGLGGWGFSFWVGEKLYHAAHGECFGHKGNITSNMAEFTAIHRALKWAHLRAFQELVVHTDSMFCYDQLTGRSRTLDEKLSRLVACIKHTEHFIGVEYKLIPRGEERQRFTDYLSKLGLTQDRQYNTLEAHLQLFRAFAQYDTVGNTATTPAR